MLTAKEQTHRDRLEVAAMTLRTACSLDGQKRDDGCGNVIVSVDFYQAWAEELTESIDWVIRRALSD